MPINVPQVNPRLATITAPNLPKIDVLGSVGAGLNLRDRLVKNRQQEGLQALIDARGQEALEGSQDAINEIALQGKEGLDFAVQLQKIAHSRNDSEIKSAKDRIKRFGTFYASIINENPEFQRRALFDEANKLLSEGDRENGAEMLQASQSRDPLDMQSHIQQNFILSQSGDKYLQSFWPGKVSAANTKFIGTPQRIIRDNKAFLSGVAQKSDGSFGLVEVAIDGEFADVQGVTASQKADQAADIERAKAQAKAEVKIATEPEIAKQVAQAKKTGGGESDDIQTLKNLEANMPAMIELADNLKELGAVASSTIGERGFDAVTRELGFGVGEGGDARAKFIAVIDNELLPLLKATFGAAFTFQEGQQLKATLGDPNLSPSEKNAQLDAYLEAKFRQANTLRRKLGIDEQDEITVDSGRDGVTSAKELSDEDLFN